MKLIKVCQGLFPIELVKKMSLMVLLISVFSCSENSDDQVISKEASHMVGEYHLIEWKIAGGWGEMGTAEVCEEHFIELHSNGVFKHGGFLENCEKDYYDTDLDYVNTGEYVGVEDGYPVIGIDITGGWQELFYVDQGNGIVKLVKTGFGGPDRELEPIGEEGIWKKYK